MTPPRAALVGLALAVAGPVVADVRLVTPRDGEVVTGSAVRVVLELDGGEDPPGLEVRLNGEDVSNRLRADGSARVVLLAGVPGRGRDPLPQVGHHRRPRAAGQPLRSPRTSATCSRADTWG